jgi:hypothetical protein
VLVRHRNLSLRPLQTERWVELVIETGREVLPNNPELQARFADDIRWAHGLPSRFSARLSD